MKRAVLTMDVEDWYHLEYLKGLASDKQYTMLDGIETFQTIMDNHQIKATFFVLGELAVGLGRKIRELAREGHEVSTHGWNHRRPMELTVSEFEADVKKSKSSLESALGAEVSGYRAPCFSLDRERLEILMRSDFRYDSSRILFGDHPLYADLDVVGFNEIQPGIYTKDGFYEFQVSTFPVLGRQLPVSGGGYLRIFPWVLNKKLIGAYLVRNDFYVLYIHPFELSRKRTPTFPTGVRGGDKIRFSLGRSTVAEKLNALIEVLRHNGFSFDTFEGLSRQLGYGKQ